MTARSYLQSGINSEKLPGIAKVRVILHPGEIKVCCPRTGNFIPCGHVEVRVGNSCSEEIKENFAKLRRQFVPGEAGRAHPAERSAEGKFKAKRIIRDSRGALLFAGIGWLIRNVGVLYL